jgi:hypothetical protein
MKTFIYDFLNYDKNNTSERMWKEAFVDYIKGLCRHLPGVTEDKHESPPSGYPVRGPTF